MLKVVLPSGDTATDSNCRAFFQKGAVSRSSYFF
jgi:hypothetical protein